MYSNPKEFCIKATYTNTSQNDCIGTCQSVKGCCNLFIEPQLTSFLMMISVIRKIPARSLDNTNGNNTKNVLRNIELLLQDSNKSINIKIFRYYVFFKDQSSCPVLVEIASC